MEEHHVRETRDVAEEHSIHKRLCDLCHRLERNEKHS